MEHFGDPDEDPVFGLDESVNPSSHESSLSAMYSIEPLGDNATDQAGRSLVNATEAGASVAVNEPEPLDPGGRAVISNKPTTSKKTSKRKLKEGMCHCGNCPTCKNRSASADCRDRLREKADKADILEGENIRLHTEALELRAELARAHRFEAEASLYREMMRNCECPAKTLFAGRATNVFAARGARTGGDPSGLQAERGPYGPPFDVGQPLSIAAYSHRKRYASAHEPGIMVNVNATQQRIFMEPGGSGQHAHPPTYVQMQAPSNAYFSHQRQPTAPPPSPQVVYRHAPPQQSSEPYVAPQYIQQSAAPTTSSARIPAIETLFGTTHAGQQSTVAYTGVEYAQPQRAHPLQTAATQTPMFVEGNAVGGRLTPIQPHDVTGPVDDHQTAYERQ